jgi:hypothetical protein
MLGLDSDQGRWINTDHWSCNDFTSPFSWRILIIFVMVLLVGVVLLGLGTAYLSKLKQQRRQAFFYRASIEIAIVLT